MIIKPKIRGFLCTTAHPVGCEMDVRQQIECVKQQGVLTHGPKKVLIIGASGGYGLASRISAAFGSEAVTIGVLFERPAEGKRTASSGWYRAAAFSRLAQRAGLYSKQINADAFSSATKSKVIKLIKKDLGEIDMLIYSLAAPARTLPDGRIARSVLKPIGASFDNFGIDINNGELRPFSLTPATPQEVHDTVKVMGGEDWEAWISALLDAGVLAEGFITTNYNYLGGEVTWPIYAHGTIGKAKEDLDRAAAALQAPLAKVNGSAYVVVMKGLVTQAAAAIPGMTLYLSLLFKFMKAQGVHENCIQQTTRLFYTRLFTGSRSNMPLDERQRIRLDDWELREDIQGCVKAQWPKVTNENLTETTDFATYRAAFLQLHGFGLPNVDYAVDLDPDVALPLVE